MSRLKRVATFCVAVCCTVLCLTVVSCNKTTETSRESLAPGATLAPGVTSAPVVTPEPFSVSSVVSTGELSADGENTVGLCADGTPLVTGDNRHGQYEANFWCDIAHIAVSDSTVIGLKYDGQMLVCGKNELTLSAITAVSDVVDFDVCGTNYALLISDGTVMTSGSVLPFKQVVDVVCAQSRIFVLSSDGTVLCSDAALSMSAFTAIDSISAFENNVAGTTGEGKVIFAEPVTFNGSLGVAVSELAEVERVAACSSALVVLRKDGSVLVQGAASLPLAELAAEHRAELEAVACGTLHCAVMTKGGEVFSKGDNSQGQTDTSWWKLRFVIDDENKTIAGFRLGMSAWDALKALQLRFGSGTVVENRTGAAASSSAVISTGMTVRVDGQTAFTVIVYGDLDGDGAITAIDYTALDGYCAAPEENPLTGSALFAAEVLHYPGGVSDITAEYAAYLRSYLDGTVKHMRQTVSSKYAKEMADVNAQNPDIVGYVRYEGTNIDYPIMYAPDYYYNYYTVTHRRSDIGSIYMLYDSYGHNNAVAGHNGRKNGVMFHELHHVQDAAETMFASYAGRIIEVSFYGRDSRWELISLYETDRYEPYKTLETNTHHMRDWSTQEVQSWIDTQLAESEYDFGITPTVEDTFMTFYTCGDKYIKEDNGARLYLIFRLVG